MLITGCRWQDLPREYGGPTTVWRRLKYWVDYRQQYTVERSVAWLGAFRRLLIRQEHLCCVSVSFFTVAVLYVCMRRIACA